MPSSYNNFKRWSISETRTLVLALLFLVLVTVMGLFMVTAGLRCVDLEGCIRENCLAYFDRY